MDEHLDQFAEDYDCDPPYPNCDDDDTPLDGDHDSTMTSVGWGSDEDYGYFGDDGDW